MELYFYIYKRFLLKLHGIQSSKLDPRIRNSRGDNTMLMFILPFVCLSPWTYLPNCSQDAMA